MKLNVICQICQKKLWEINKQILTEEDMEAFQRLAQCDIDGDDEKVITVN